jgi:hypothetical protein
MFTTDVRSGRLPSAFGGAHRRATVVGAPHGTPDQPCGRPARPPNTTTSAWHLFRPADVSNQLTRSVSWSRGVSGHSGARSHVATTPCPVPGCPEKGGGRPSPHVTRLLQNDYVQVFVHLNRDAQNPVFSSTDSVQDARESRICKTPVLPQTHLGSQPNSSRRRSCPAMRVQWPIC